MSQAPEPKRRGRPPVPEADQRRSTTFRLRPATLDKLARVAAQDGVSQAAWLERQIERARESRPKD